MARKLQGSLFDGNSRLRDHEFRREHGGGVRKGRRKLARPVDTRKALHLTLRSARARGVNSMLRPEVAGKIKTLIHTQAAKNHIKIIQYANSGNHLHILLRAKTKDGFKAFLRTIAGLIARWMTGAVKGRPGKFWDALAYTRIVTWNRDLFNAKFYVVMNELESVGIWSRNFKNRPRRANSSVGPP